MSYIIICVVFLIGTISIPNILGQSDEINNNVAMKHHQKDISPNIIDKYFNNNTLVHQKDFVNNVTLHYVIGGHGDPILLLHGWPETWYEWRNIIPSLIANNYTIIALDMRGLGDSEKPQTGYDKKTVAEDIYQLVKKLGYSKIYLVAHDWGGPVAYSYAAVHPEDIQKMIIIDVPLPGFGVEEAAKFSPNGIWHLSFHAVRDLPEKLIEGKEDLYLNWFYDHYSYNQSAITSEAREEYIKQYSKPGAMRAGFEYYRAFPINVEQNKEHANVKLAMPVLALGGKYTDNAALISMKSLATDVRGGIVPFSGHWIPEERPDFLIEQLTKFFRE
jgi:pimeloyl-ACP methyl ester carboxylesterase